jgi:hypothetical protein
MSNTQVVTLRLPKDLKKRLQREAKYQGVSVNQLANYLLNLQLTQLESISALEARLSTKSIHRLKWKAKKLLSNVPSKEVPEWDKVD